MNKKTELTLPVINSIRIIDDDHKHCDSFCLRIFFLNLQKFDLWTLDYEVKILFMCL